MISLLTRLRRDERGASLIEFVLLASAMATVVVGITDVTRAYSMKLTLEQAAQRAIEKFQQQSRSLNDYTTLSTEATTAATAAGYPNATAAVSYKLECNGTTKTSNTTGSAINSSCNDGETYSRYVSVTLTDHYSPMFINSYFPGAQNGSVTLTGYAAMRVQ
jgi:Flp pilus assembly protein TadG